MSTERPILVAGNWKMNHTPSEALVFYETLLKQLPSLHDGVEALICPPTIGLESATDLLEESPIMLGAQTMDYHESGAYTGETAPSMLCDLGVSHVIIGHSERREYYNETNETVALKAEAALKHNLIPIVCVGESENERESDQTDRVIENQIKQGLSRLSKVLPNLTNLVIAYEPIWAIGTGKTCDATEANRVCAHIRNTIKELFGDEAAQHIRILYGGSVKPSNANELFGQSDIDGGLVGGASLKVDSYTELLQAALQQTCCPA